MLRTTLAAIAGMLAGLAATVGVLRGAAAVLAWATAPQVFTIEHGVIYTTLVLGAGFGAVCGTLIGLGGAVVRARRDRSPG